MEKLQLTSQGSVAFYLQDAAGHPAYVTSMVVGKNM
jgi:hypothetical protein